MKIKVPEIEIRYLDYRKLTPFQGNLKDLYEKNFNRLKKSLEEKGGFIPMFVWIQNEGKRGQTYWILDGHQRQRVFLKEKAAFEHDGKHGEYEYPCQVIKADSEEDAKERLLVISSQFGTITQEGFDEFTFDLKDEWLEDTVQFDRIMSEVKEEEPEAEEDEGAGEVPANPITVLGDLYELHSLDSGIVHRIQCGDSTDADVVNRTVCGKKIDFVFTDPPYGMNAVSNSGVLSKNYDGDIKGDDSTDCAVNSFTLTHSLFTCPQVWWGANYYSSTLPDSECWLVWDKNNGDSDQTDCELAWTNFRSVVRKFTQASEKTNRVHPTQKPLSLVTWSIKKSKSEPLSIYDPFLGSGTTLIAAEQLGRVCYGQELDEKYMDVIVRRWVKYMMDNEKRFAVSRNGRMLTKEEVADLIENREQNREEVKDAT